MIDSTRNFTRFEDSIRQLNEAEARLMDVQVTIMTQQTAMLAGSTNIFNQHNKDFKDYHPPRSLKLNIPRFDEIGSLLEATPEDLRKILNITVHNFKFLIRRSKLISI